MSNLATKQVPSDFGDVVYYSYYNPKAPEVNLYIHGLGYCRSWFPRHFDAYDLNRYSWIVPDLIGHGDSARPDDPSAYTMESQAEYLLDILLEENVNRIRILAHSMGGPIAISLLEQLENNGSIKPMLLLYLEGNLDAGDTFFSSKVVSMPLEKYRQKFEHWCQKIQDETEDESMKSWVRALESAGPFTIWASSNDLVTVSKTDNLLPRLFDVFDGPMYFVFGGENAGKYTSEKLVKESGEQILYVPNAGHAMHEDNPTGFWSIVFRLIEKHS
ncbi:MAG: alpha/beta hydrolase [Candidatus Thorarchaeota archaeon]